MLGLHVVGASYDRARDYAKQFMTPAAGSFIYCLSIFFVHVLRRIYLFIYLFFSSGRVWGKTKAQAFTTLQLIFVKFIPCVSWTLKCVISIGALPQGACILQLPRCSDSDIHLSLLPGVAEKDSRIDEIPHAIGNPTVTW